MARRALASCAAQVVSSWKERLACSKVNSCKSRCRSGARWPSVLRTAGVTSARWYWDLFCHREREIGVILWV
eukprot:5866666-Amphidinium_carterae.3